MVKEKHPFDGVESIEIDKITQEMIDYYPEYFIDLLVEDLFSRLYFFQVLKEEYEITEPKIIDYLSDLEKYAKQLFRQGLECHEVHAKLEEKTGIDSEFEDIEMTLH